MEDKGFILVKVGKLPGVIKEVGLSDCDGERTIAKALKGAELEKEEGYEVRVNNDVVADDDVADYELSDGDIVILVEDIVGN
ncbi:MAG: hypothetical protein WC668_00890 [Patescibacteria group bacterium]|jgi:sulfur carrier protein ThiS